MTFFNGDADNTGANIAVHGYHLFSQFFNKPGTCFGHNDHFLLVLYFPPPTSTVIEQP